MPLGLQSCGARKQVTEAPLVTHPLTELTVMEDPVGHGDARVDNVVHTGGVLSVGMNCRFIMDEMP